MYLVNLNLTVTVLDLVLSCDPVLIFLIGRLLIPLFHRNCSIGLGSESDYYVTKTTTFSGFLIFIT